MSIILNLCIFVSLHFRCIFYLNIFFSNDNYFKYDFKSEKSIIYSLHININHGLPKPSGLCIKCSTINICHWLWKTQAGRLHSLTDQFEAPVETWDISSNNNACIPAIHFYMLQDISTLPKSITNPLSSRSLPKFVHSHFGVHPLSYIQLKSLPEILARHWSVQTQSGLQQ